MKNMWKYILIGFGVLILDWVFISCVHSIFNGLSDAGGVALGTGLFLAFEMVICTGAIISKINQAKEQINRVNSNLLNR